MRNATMLCAAALGAMTFASASAAPQSAAPLRLSEAWSRATPPAAITGAGYLTITNTGKSADRLVGGSTAVAAKLEIHEMSMTGGVMRMRPLKDGLAIGPGQSVTLKPGGYHLMLIGLKRPLNAGERLPVTLTFERAGAVKTELEVRGPGGQPAGDHHAMPGMGQ